MLAGGKTNPNQTLLGATVEGVTRLFISIYIYIYILTLSFFISALLLYLCVFVLSFFFFGYFLSFKWDLWLNSHSTLETSVYRFMHPSNFPLGVTKFFESWTYPITHVKSQLFALGLILYLMLYLLFLLSSQSSCCVISNLIYHIYVS